MEMFVGIDVSKDRLDVHIRPKGESFAVSRDGKGLEELVARLSALAPIAIAVEATGGFETIDPRKTNLKPRAARPGLFFME